MTRLAVLALLIPLTACSEAQMCRYSATRPLTELDRQIRETEQNIARGYMVVEVQPVYSPPVICRPPLPPRPPHPPGPRPGYAPPPEPPQEPSPAGSEPPPPVPAPGLPPSGEADAEVTRAAPYCVASPPVPRYAQVRINVEAERAKLASLRSQRERLLPQVRARLAQCPAE